MILGLIPIDCKDDDPECSFSTSDLMVSKNSGATWEKILGFVNQAQWDKHEYNYETNRNRIIMVHYNESILIFIHIADL